MGAIFVSTFNNVVPLFAVVFVGYALKRFGILPEHLAGPMNALCFRILFPCLCIRSMQTITFRIEYLWLLVYMTATFLISIPILCRLVPLAVPRRGQAGVVIQAAYRSNSVSFAMPLIFNIMGEENSGPMLVIVAMAAVLFNSTAVVVLNRFSETNAEASLTLRGMSREVATNPIIVGTVIGIAIQLLPFEMPALILKPVLDLGACATPMAMLAIGLRFRFQSLAANRRPILLASAVKLAVMPLVWTAVGFLLGFRHAVLCAIFLEHACPSATGSVPMAEAMGCDGELAGELVLAQTAASCVTIFCGVCILRLLALI